MELPEHVAENRRHWDADAVNWVAAGEADWARQVPQWGIWRIPETDMSLLPSDMNGIAAIELGCGTAYVSAWMARRGATVVGIDNSEQQLVTASRLASEHGIDLTLVHGNAEAAPYPDGSFDFAISEYGAAIWCDPEEWIPEAHRLLRQGGNLVFLGSHPLAIVCSRPDGAPPLSECLQRDYFGLGRIDWRDASVDPGGIEFNLPISTWMELFAATGFEIVDFIEVQAPRPGPEIRFMATADWAYRFPCEQVWKLRKR